MADSNSAVIMQKQHSLWLTNDIASANHYALFACNVSARWLDKLHNASRCAWQKTVIAYHYFAHIYRVESVNVLVRSDVIYYHFIVKVLWQWELNEYSVHSVVVIELFDKVE